MENKNLDKKKQGLNKEEILKSMARLKKSYLRSYNCHRRIADQIWLKINDLDMQMQGLADDVIMENGMGGENHVDYGGENKENTWTN